MSAVHVVAVGARGGDAFAATPGDGLGGQGGRVEGDLAVAPGQTLYVVVGTTPPTPDLDTFGQPTAGGFNGGGTSGHSAGGGGGASDVRALSAATPGSLSTRLLVAAGGGGGGAYGFLPPAFPNGGLGGSGRAGTAGTQTGSSPFAGQGGAPGSVELVTCTTKKVKKRTKTTCRGGLVSGPLKFTFGNRATVARATLLRGHRVVARGTAVRRGKRMRLLLKPSGALRPGRYTVRLAHRRLSVVLR